MKDVYPAIWWRPFRRSYEYADRKASGVFLRAKKTTTAKFAESILIQSRHQPCSGNQSRFDLLTIHTYWQYLNTPS